MNDCIFYLADGELLDFCLVGVEPRRRKRVDQRERERGSQPTNQPTNQPYNPNLLTRTRYYLTQVNPRTLAMAGYLEPEAPAAERPVLERRRSKNRVSAGLCHGTADQGPGTVQRLR